MRFLLYIMLIFCFFPYLDFLKLGTDTQPNALLLGCVALLCLKDKKVNTPIILLMVTFLLAVMLIFFNDLSLFLYIKNTVNYLAPPVVALAIYNLMIKLDMKVDFRFFLGIVLFYGFVSLVQFYIKPDFLTFLITDNTRGNMYMGRGVISLCPEPAFYGSQCIFLMIFSLLAYNKKQNLIALPIILYQLVFLARSSTALAILVGALILFSLYQILRFRMSYVLGVLLIVLAVTPIIQNKVHDLEQTRAGGHIIEFAKNPLLLTQIDASAGVRFTYMASPFLAMKHNHFLPMGLGQFRPFIRDLYKDGMYHNFLVPYLIKNKEIITGSINMVLFQLGFLGLLFPAAIILAFKRLLSVERVLFAMLLFICILFTQIQLMHSMTGLIIAYAMTLSYFKNKEEPELA